MDTSTQGLSTIVTWLLSVAAFIGALTALTRFFEMARDVKAIRHDIHVMVPREAKMTAVLEYFQQNAGAHPVAAAKALGIDAVTMREIVEQLTAEGRLGGKRPAVAR